MKKTFEKFSDNYKKSLKDAANLALELKHQAVNPEHILYGLVKQRGSVGAEIFTNFKLKTDELKNNIAKSNQGESQSAAENLPKFSSEAKDIIQKSVQIAYINRHKYIGTEHLLAAMIEAKDNRLKKIFETLNIPDSQLTEQIITVLKSTSKLPELTETFKVTENKELNFDPNHPKTNTSLSMFGHELTDSKNEKVIDPVIGRQEEVSRIIEILSRRTKNNPIVLGDPGVGKTAIIEGLAKKIAAGDVPSALKNKKIYSLDLASMLAGTMYRGEFEGRLKQIVNEVKNQPDTILFIDEIHNIVGTGAASGSMDTANILKPALARGEIRCIGATTLEDYRKSIENDPALNRRFQPVRISEPNAEETKKILLGIRKYYEKFHRVEIKESAIDSAISLSQRYLQDRFLPDKAIDLIDEACANARVNQKISGLEKKIETMAELLEEIKIKKIRAIESENFEKAMELKKDFQKTEVELEQIKKKQQPEKNIAEITEENIIKIIARMTGMKPESLMSSENTKILQLNNQLKKTIIGQDEAINEIANYIKRAKAGLTSENKPTASFIFAGPSGVGKTYTAKKLAEMLFAEENALIKIDMSEYTEKFNMSKLIGAPAGYVGYRESGQLTEKVKHKPYSIVLFDEMEKANPEIFDLLLQILDDGYLTDAGGTKINFRNSIIIMTTNIGSDLISQEEIGFGQDNQEKTAEKQNNPQKEKTLKLIKNNFKPELLNRINNIIYFPQLTKFDLEKITKKYLTELVERLAKRQLELSYSPAVSRTIAQEAESSKEGARAIEKIIQNKIEPLLSELILSGELKSDNPIQISAKNGIIKVE